MTDIPRLTSEALSLPLDDRIRLAQELWASLHPTRAADADEEAKAIDSADRRDADFESQTVEGVSHVDAIATARKSLECK